MQRTRQIIGSVLVFLSAFAFLYWSNGHRFVLMTDEAIYLQGARRILAGEVPYSDFFVGTGPGSHWLNAAALWIFGVTLSGSRILTLLDLSVLVTCVYWLVARRGNIALGAFAAACCLVMELSDPQAVLPNHRWESTMLATLGATILASEAGVAGTILAGALLEFSAWVTPTMGVVSLALGAYIAWRDRARLRPLLIGFTGTSAIAAAALAAQGALVPMIQQMLWLGANYRSSNYTTYGSYMNGYGRLLNGASGAEWIIAMVIATGIALPAILPVLALPFVWKERLSSLAPAWIAAFALLLSAHPRYDVQHLLFGTPLFYALAALSAAMMSHKFVKMAAFLATVAITLTFFTYTLLRRSADVPAQARIGSIRAAKADVTLLHDLEHNIPAGSRLFVFPYLPMAYFATLADNATRFSYMQPGQMTESDEDAVIADLRAHPADRVLFQDLTEDQILLVWPSTDRARLHLRRIEQFLADRYQRIETIPYPGGNFQVLTPKSPVTASN